MLRGEHTTKQLSHSQDQQLFQVWKERVMPLDPIASSFFEGQREM